MRKFTCIPLFNICWLSASAQIKNLPVIDMHMHALNEYMTYMEYLPCIPKPCETLKTKITDLSEVLPLTVEEMRKNNVVLGVVSTISWIIPRETFHKYLQNLSIRAI